MARGLMSPLLGRADSAFITIGKTATSIVPAKAIAKGRIEERRGVDVQNRNFMRYFTLITKYLIEDALRKG